MAPPQVRTPPPGRGGPGPVSGITTIQRAPGSLAGLPLVSIVIDTLNQEDYLERALLSILHQDYPRVEVLVMDRGSKDGTVELIRKYEAYISYWCSDPKETRAAAMSEGLERAKGDVFLCLSAGDFLLEGALTVVANYFVQHPNVEVLSGGSIFVGADGSPIKDSYVQCGLGVSAASSRMLYYGDEGVYLCSTFFRRRAYEAVGEIDRSLRYCMDYDLLVRLAKRKRFAGLSMLLSCYRTRRHPSPKLEKAREKEREKIADAHGANRLGPIVRGLGYAAYRMVSLLNNAYWLLLRWTRQVNPAGVLGEYPLDQPRFIEEPQLADSIS